MVPRVKVNMYQYQHMITFGLIFSQTTVCAVDTASQNKPSSVTICSLRHVHLILG